MGVIAILTELAGGRSWRHDDVRRGAVFAARGMLTSATMIVAFWLQFGTKLFQRTPAPQIMLWLGFGSIAAAVLTLATLKAGRAKPRPGTVA